MNQTQNENNKLVAEFMGAYSKQSGYDYTKIGNKGVSYHTEWNWLLPVVRKVLTLIDINKLDFDTTALKDEVLDDDIKQAYKEVLRFINWYNNQYKVDIMHQHIRDILIKYKCPEYGDCIVDEICHLFNYSLTNNEN